MISNELILISQRCKGQTEVLIFTLWTTKISLSTSTERLFACTMRVYSGFECTGKDICSAVLGFDW